MTRLLKYSEAIQEAIYLGMEHDPSVYIMGLGVPDPKGIFGTTLGLEHKFGSDRVMDMPTSENGMMGVAIGSSILGMKPIVTHQRADFFLLALDQLLNNAAKWHYMFDGKMTTPIVIRLIIGRGWGQGPQHSQNLAATLSHFPGLKVIAPATSSDMKGLLLAAINDPNPVVILEHRWLYNNFGSVDKSYYELPIGKAHTVREGTDVTIVSYSYGVIEAIRAADELKQQGIAAEVIDLRSIKPLDIESISKSLMKTKRLVVFDLDWKCASISSEILSSIFEMGCHNLEAPPERITLPDSYVPTSWYLANDYYPTKFDIIRAVKKMFGLKIKDQDYPKDPSKPLDVPDKEFTGPF